MLAVYQDEDIRILDSLVDAPLSHRRVRYYVPQYSINANHRWAHIPTRSRASDGAM